MKINTVAIIGAGAIGAYFVWGLTDKLKDNLWVIADGERKERLEAQGLMINNKNHKLNVKTPDEAKGVDLLLVATKYGALRSILDDVAKIVDDHTIVMSLLNGVDSEEILSERIDKKQIVYSLMKIASQRVGNEIRFDGPSTLGVYFGEENNGTLDNNNTDRIKALVDISESESASAKGSKSSKSARYSTLQDIDAKRHTEVDMFAGAMVRMGKELGIATPYNEYTYNVIKAIEERNDGKFDY